MIDTLPKSSAVRRVVAAILSSLLLAGLTAAPSYGDSFTFTKHSEYQAVYDDGTAAWPSGSASPYPIEMIGVVINDPLDMLNYEYDATDNPSPQWQVYIQATETDDFGGTALYMRKYLPYGSKKDLYSGAITWEDEMQRLNYPLDSISLRRGDKIKVEALAPGMPYNGKYNINTKHADSTDADYLTDKVFTITILERGVALDAATITLGDLKDGNDDFIFDDTRATGCEHYQASLVHLDDLLLDNPEDWALYDPDNPLIVRQGNLTFPMVLGIDPALEAIDANALSTTPFGITAILDQESSDPTSNYRLWLTSVSDLGGGAAVPEPCAALLAAIGALAVLAGLRRRGFRRVA